MSGMSLRVRRGRVVGQDRSSAEGRVLAAWKSWHFGTSHKSWRWAGQEGLAHLAGTLGRGPGFPPCPQPELPGEQRSRLSENHLCFPVFAESRC